MFTTLLKTRWMFRSSLIQDQVLADVGLLPLLCVTHTLPPVDAPANTLPPAPTSPAPPHSTATPSSPTSASYHLAGRRSFHSSRSPCVTTWCDERASCSPHGCQKAHRSLGRLPSLDAPYFQAPQRRCAIFMPPPTPTAVDGRVARCLLRRPLSLGRPRRNVHHQLRSPPRVAAGAPMTARTGCRYIPKAGPRGERDRACRRHAPRKCTRR